MARPVSRPTRWLLIAAGWLSVGVAVVGVALPLLPTTPFLIVAAYCFSRSSRRLEGWLLDHRAFGPLIRDWRAHRGLTVRNKILSVLAIAGTFFVSLVVAVDGVWPRAGLLLVAVTVATFLMTRPTVGHEHASRSRV